MHAEFLLCERNGSIILSMRNIVASIPADRNTDEDVMLSDALMNAGITAVREGNTVTFHDVRSDQRNAVLEYLRSAGLDYDPAASFYLF